MKKFFLFILVLNYFTISYAQYWNEYYGLWDWMRNDERLATEQTKDDAYLAPSNKLVGKKWYLTNGNAVECLTFNQNGTGSDFLENVTYNSIVVQETIPIQWKRKGLDLTLTYLFGSATIRPTQSSIAQLSLRKQDEIKQSYVDMEKKERQKGTQTFTYKIEKLEDDIICIEGLGCFVTQSKADELIKRRAAERKRRELNSQY